MLRLPLIWTLFRRAAHIQKKRMVMTVAAIAWGTISIVLLLSFGEGLKRSFTKGSRGMGEGIVVVWPGSTSKAYAGFPQGRNLSFVPEDIDLIRSSIPELGSASGEMGKWGVNVSYGRKTFSKHVIGAEPEYGELRNQIAEEGGRFIDQRDFDEKRRVAFLGDKVKEELFGGKNAVGETILIGQIPFQVIGVMQKKIQMGTYSGPDKNHLVMPMSTFRAIYGRRKLQNLVLRAATIEQTPVLKRQLYTVLGGKYRFDPEDHTALQMWDTVKSQAMTRNISVGIEFFLGIIGGLTLLIGGVGVANIMYAVVKHRTREIGVQMALGARRSFVLGPLLLEALSLTALGGGIGIVVGVGIVQLLGILQAKSGSDALQFMGAPTFSPGVALTTVVVLGTIGFFAGYFPARRAVRIQPAVALRYE